MARQAQDREDLLRDATALVPRLMLRLSVLGAPCDLFAGFRGEQSLSIYFDADPVYHFNSRRELRRAFCDGQILKANGGSIIAWKQRRNTDEVTMLSRHLFSTEQQDFDEQLLGRISELRKRLQNRQFELIGQVPDNGDVLGRLQAWIDEFDRVIVANKAGLK